jgi:IclR family KDG regulon transcriptional repressor
VEKRRTSLENALMILDLFSVEEPQLSVKEIAEKLSIASSTVHRLLTSLMEEEMITKDLTTHRYRLSVMIRSIEKILTKENKLYQASKQHLNEFSKKYSETISLCVVHKEKLCYLYTVWGNEYQYPELVYPGKEYALEETSGGRVIAAYEFQQIFMQSPMESQIRERGYDVFENTYNRDFVSIAVPIYKYKRVIAAIEMVSSHKRISKQQYVIFAEILKVYSQKIKSDLEYLD